MVGEEAQRSDVWFFLLIHPLILRLYPRLWNRRGYRISARYISLSTVLKRREACDIMGTLAEGTERDAYVNLPHHTKDTPIALSHPFNRDRRLQRFVGHVACRACRLELGSLCQKSRPACLCRPRPELGARLEVVWNILPILSVSTWTVSFIPRWWRWWWWRQTPSATWQQTTHSKD